MASTTGRSASSLTAALGLSLLLAAAGPGAAPVGATPGSAFAPERRVAPLSVLAEAVRPSSPGGVQPDADAAAPAAGTPLVEAQPVAGPRIVVAPQASQPDPPAAPSRPGEDEDAQADTPYRSGLSGSDLDARLAGIVRLARSLEVAGYLWGGTTPAGFDCSGFTQYVYDKVAIELPRTAEEQYHALNTISRAEARPGDLVFFPRSDGFVYHVAIYLGNGMIVEARNPRVGVLVDPIWAADVTFGTVRDVGHRPGGFITGRTDPTPRALTVGFDILPWAGDDYTASVSTAYSARITPAPATRTPTVTQATATPTPTQPAPTTPSVTKSPTVTPSAAPSVEPSAAPSVEPSAAPSVEPSATPSVEPSASPAVSAEPSPTTEPSASPTGEPSASPTGEPSASPTPTPPVTTSPTAEPTPPVEEPATTTLRLRGPLVDVDGSADTKLSATLASEDEACFVGRPVSFEISADGTTWSLVGSATSASTGTAQTTWTHAASLVGVRFVRATATTTDACAAASARAYLALGRPADQFVGAGSDSGSPRARFGFRLGAEGLSSGEFLWSDGQVRLTATSLSSVEPLTCPDGYAECVAVSGEAAVERLVSGDWTPSAPVSFTAVLLDGADSDAFGLSLEVSADRPLPTDLSSGSISVRAGA